MYKIQEFCIKNKDWKTLLSKEPYSLFIREKENLVLFLYHHFESDFSLDIVREARGIIFEEKTFVPVCVGFDKFFNIQEKYAAKIKWETAKVEEKVDGSIIKLYFYNNQWNIATNGTINAYDANLPLPDGGIRTFGDLVHKTLFERYDLDLDSDYTYIFEVVSPYNRVVVPYRDIDIYHLGARHNISGKEIDIDIGIKKPKLYDLKDKEAVLSMAKTFDFNNEGFVIKDENFNRIKVKSEDYLRVHRIKGEDVPTAKNILGIVINESEDDFLGLFPEYKGLFEGVINKLKDYLLKVEKDIEEYKKNKWESKKDFAIGFAKECTSPDLMFSIYDGKISLDNWYEEYIKTMDPRKLKEKIGANIN